jgi:hypothetical protein
MTWSRVSSELRRRGHGVAVPSLVEGAATGRWQKVVDAAVRDASHLLEDHIVVGHSGAGPLLPVVACRLLVRPQYMVFVDAGVPPEHGDATLVPGELLDQLRQLATDGRLPKWSEWFGPDTMRLLVPERELREEITRELPQIPVSYFEQTVPMPDGWTNLRSAYLLLSDPYRQDAEEARSRGWRTIEIDGTHLDIVTRPREVTDALLDAVAA